MTVAEDLITAANIMKERGRCVAHLIGEDGQCCPLGAIGFATIHGFGDESETWRYIALEALRPNAAVRTLAGAICAEEKGGDPVDNQGIVYRYNDNVVESDQEMIDTMLKAAEAANDKGM